MTYDAAASVRVAKENVGYHEGHNNLNKFSPWQGLNAYNPWCASFTCYCAVVGGGYVFPTNSTFGTRGEAYCPTLKQRAQQEGLWSDRSWRAQPGDFVLFDWGNNGLIDHVELVIYDDGTTIITIGGNTSDMCAFRTRNRANVAGFYALSQSPQAKPVLDPATLQNIARLVAWKKRVSQLDSQGHNIGALHLGDTSGDVSILNDLLVALGLLVKKGNTYTKGTRDAVVHLKKLHHLPNLVGITFGAEAAEAILTPR